MTKPQPNRISNGDMEGRRAWQWIEAAIVELLRAEPGEGEGVH